MGIVESARPATRTDHSPDSCPLSAKRPTGIVFMAEFSMKHKANIISFQAYRAHKRPAVARIGLLNGRMMRANTLSVSYTHLTLPTTPYV